MGSKPQQDQQAKALEKQQSDLIKQQQGEQNVQRRDLAKKRLQSIKDLQGSSATGSVPGGVGGSGGSSAISLMQSLDEENKKKATSPLGNTLG